MKSNYYATGHTFTIQTNTDGSGVGKFTFKDSAFSTVPFEITTAGSGNSNLYINGTISLNLITGGQQQVCINSGTVGILSTCSSSLRYKKNVNPFTPGLNMVKKLRPITFDWKDGGMHDLGFGAEDVAKIEPLLVTHNARGEIEGVKYDRITAVLVNALKEQQSQIALQSKQIQLMQGQIVALRNARRPNIHQKRRSNKAR